MVQRTRRVDRVTTLARIVVCVECGANWNANSSPSLGLRQCLAKHVLLNPLFSLPSFSRNEFIVVNITVNTLLEYALNSIQSILDNIRF